MYVQRFRNTLTFAVSIAAVLAIAPAQGQFAFAPTVNVAVGPQPGGAAVGDLDDDGDQDLATGIQFPDRVVILLNDGSGGFSSGPIINFPNGSQPEEVLAGDVDGDTDRDLAVILRGLLQVRVLINTGNLVFVQGASASIGADGRGMDMKDMDNDGDLDLAVANRGSNTATVLRNNGNATFVSIMLSSVGEPRAAAFGDLDGDTDLDLAVTNNDAFNVRLFRNDAGTFNAWHVLSTAPNQAEGITAADLDDDGDIDLVTGADDDNAGVSNAVIFHNNGGGVSFAGPLALPTSGLGTSGVVTVDLDCDGLLDLALSNQDSNNLSLLGNLGAGTFEAAVLRPVGTNPEALNFGDLDGDGLADLVTSNRDSGNVSVLLNQTCQPSPSADLNGDGVVGPADLALLLGSWGACAGCSADLNNDGVIGPNDLALLLGNWG